MVVIDSPVHLAGSDVFMPMSEDQALVSRRHGTHTVLTGLLDLSALYGVLAEIEALGLNGGGRSCCAGHREVHRRAGSRGRVHGPHRLLQTGATTGKLVHKP